MNDEMLNDDHDKRFKGSMFPHSYEESEAYEKKGDRDPRTVTFVIKQLINVNRLDHSTKLTGQLVTCLVFCYCNI